MYLNHDKRLAFLAHPRTASRAMRNALQQRGFVQVGGHHDGPENGYPIPDGYLPFCVIRNHWDACVSWWFNARMDKNERYPSLYWLASHFSKNRYYFRAGDMWWFTRIPGVRILKYEHLQVQLDTLLQEFYIPEVDLVSTGPSWSRMHYEGEDQVRRHYSLYFDSHTRHFVEWCFLKEINHFHYAFEEVPSWEGKGRAPVLPPPVMRPPDIFIPKRDEAAIVDALLEKPYDQLHVGAMHGPANVMLDAYIKREEEEEEDSPTDVREL